MSTGQNSPIFQDKVILITGGTGSLGRSLIRRIMTGEQGVPRRVTVFSRDEDKQYQMRLEWKGVAAATDDIMYRNAERALDFCIGDVREYDTVARAVNGVDIIIHAAAIKQAPVCEYFPYESVKTNILGVQNLIRAIADNHHKASVLLAVSTDKACKPINVYGMCKAIQERLAIEANLRDTHTRYICTRYGNVVASRGSVIPLFREQIKSGGPITITAGDMTRFMITMDMAVDAIFDAVKVGEAGDIFVPELRSANIVDLAGALIGKRQTAIKYIGVRPGEKTHEILITEEELPRTVKRDRYYVIRPVLPELRGSTPIEPVLDRELSSADFTMTRNELETFLRKEGLLDY